MIKNILFGVDGSTFGDIAGEYSFDLASRLDARLEAIHVVDSRLFEYPLIAPQAGIIDWNSASVNALQQALRERGENLLRATAARAEQAGIPLVTTLEFGHPAQVLADIQARTELVVLGRQGEHSKAAPDIPGSTMERFIRRADRPCLVTPGVFRAIGKIMVGVDGSPSAARALHEAIEFANALHAPLVILSVAENESDPGRVRQANLDAHTIARAHDCAAASLVVVGPPGHRILEKAHEMSCDLVVIGAHGHGRIYDRLIGGGASHVVSRARIPVMIVR